MAFSNSHIAQQVEKHFPRTAHHIFNIMIEQTPPNTKLVSNHTLLYYYSYLLYSISFSASTSIDLPLINLFLWCFLVQQISKAFWVRYCDSFSNQVFPKLPCGSTEEAELTKSSDGKEHNVVDIDDSNEDSNSRPNKIRKTSPYGNSEAANKIKPVSEANTDHDNQGIGTNNNNNKRPSCEAATEFFTENPYFQVKLRAHQLRGDGKLYIQVAIAKSWFEKKAQIVSLWVGEEYWHVNLAINKGSSSSGLEYRFSGGWHAFARDNSLQPNDVCIFELINKNKPEVKVTIFRQSESSMAQQ
ncbi:B3 domain-containing protein REM19-like [Cannabis sativa]|uniref:B3 domain-containing protein REM19-like n=1 Tax=Cannabis sativa TaxID=3483 RepID=UPI0029CA1D86|nr:B3 domain-containing protein REM19-like [Cannabis sativa]